LCTRLKNIKESLVDDYRIDSIRSSAVEFEIIFKIADVKILLFIKYDCYE